MFIVGVKLLPPRGLICSTNSPETTGGILFLTYLGIVSLSGEVGGYPQALLKVVNLQGMLELSEILILVRSPPLCPNVNNIP